MPLKNEPHPLRNLVPSADTPVSAISWGFKDYGVAYVVLYVVVWTTLQALWHTSVGHTILTGGLYLLGIGCCLIQVVGLIELMTRLRFK